MNQDGYAATNSSPSMNFPVPRAEELVGKFPNLQIEHFIGHGGMGAVYQARQIGLDRPVALKILSPRLGSDPTFTERFTREARTLAKLNHPNIVTVFEYGKTEQMNYLVMEFVDGVNLRDAIQEGRLSTEEALAIVPQVCDALQYAHDEGVIHRDIKPENILIDKKGRVKIADFGLAKLLEPSHEDYTLTGTQQVLGTRNYMAPEQIETPDQVDHRADLYSLGVVFYELLTGELPLGRFAVPSEKSSVNNQLDDVVLRTLEKEPGRRFQQASEIRTAVESVAQPNGQELESAYAQADQQANPQRQPQLENHQQEIDQPTSTAPTEGNFARLSLPFTIPELYAGCACAYGIAHIRENGIELEFEIRDEVFGSVKSAAKKVLISSENIVAVRLHDKFFSTRLEIQTDRLDVVNEVPNSKQGQFGLKIKKTDRERGEVFAAELTRIAGIAIPTSFGHEAAGQQQFTPTPPAPPVKTKATGDPVGQHIEENKSNALKAPQVGLFVAGIIDLIWGIKYFSTGFRAGGMEEWALNFLPEFKVSIPSIGLSGIIAITMAIWIFSVSQAIKEKRDYKFILISAIIFTFTGFHPAYTVTLVFAIWTLILVLNPETKASFSDMPDRSAATPAYPYARSGPSSVVWTFIGMFALAMVGLAVTVIIWMAMSYKTEKKDARSDKPISEAAIESVSATSDGDMPISTSVTRSKSGITAQATTSSENTSSKVNSPVEKQNPPENESKVKNDDKDKSESKSD